MVLLGNGSEGQVGKVSRGANGSPGVQDPFGQARMAPNPPKLQFWANSRGRARPLGQVAGRSTGAFVGPFVGPVRNPLLNRPVLIASMARLLPWASVHAHPLLDASTSFAGTASPSCRNTHKGQIGATGLTGPWPGVFAQTLEN